MDHFYQPTKQKRFALKKSVQAVSGVLLATLGVAGATAQEEEAALEEIVVTGTLIRGTEATGSQVISLDAEAISDVGAVTTNELCLPCHKSPTSLTRDRK